MSDIENNSNLETEPDQEVEWDEQLKSEEINDLLGFDLSAEGGEDRSGLKALINSVLVSHRRLPMLDVVFDRTARQMTTSLRHLTNDNVEVTLDDISSTRFGDFLGAVSEPSIVGVLKARELDNYCLIAVDAALVYSVVDVLLGGKRGGGLVTMDDRSFTQIELGLVKKVLDLMAEDLTRAIQPIANVEFIVDRIETTPRFAAIAQDASVCSLAKFGIAMEERGGRAAILTPHATLEPIFKVLQREFINESGGSENIWRDHLAGEIAAAKLDLKVILAEKEITISDLDRLKAGETILFKSAANNKAEIRSGDAVIARGQVGRTGEAIAIRLAQSSALEPECERADEEAA